jgi:hypothetical protein
MSTAATAHAHATHVDWDAATFCGVAFSDCGKVDFRTKQWRNVLTLYTSSIEPAAQQNASKSVMKQLRSICQNLHTTYGGAPTSLHADLQPVPPQQLLPVVPVIRACVLGWWTRWQCKQKGIGFYTRHRLRNMVDPISLEHVDDIPPPFVFTLGEYVFDIRELRRMAQSGMRNPFTNMAFGADAVGAIAVRWRRITERLRYDVGDAEAAPPLTSQQRALAIFQKMDALGYVTDIAWFTSMDIKQLRLWYVRVEDIWNYRAQLSDSAKRVIVPHAMPPLFRHILTVHAGDNIETVRDIVLETMDRLVSSAAATEDRGVGVMYVLSALTESCEAASSALPWLYQPPH